MYIFIGIVVDEQENSGVQYVEGTAVSTPDGNGIIQSYDSTSKLYTVKIGDTTIELPRHSILILPTAESGSDEEVNEGSSPEEEVPIQSIEKSDEEVPIQVDIDGIYYKEIVLF